MGFSLGGLVRAATESTLNIITPGRGIVRSIQTGDPTHLIPFGQSYKEWGRQLGSVLEAPAKEAAAGFAEGIAPDVARVKAGWRFLGDHQDEIKSAAVLTSPGLGFLRGVMEHPKESLDVAGRAWKLFALGQV